ncbi:hypothetical protein GCM10027417_00600 [Glutamicibacter endophyticus]
MTTALRTLRPALRVAAVAVVALAALFLSLSPAHAHDELVASTPKAGATLKEAPKELTLEYSGVLQELPGGSSTVVKLTRGGQEVATSFETKERTVTVTPDSELEPGDYTLAIRVVSSDGHPVENSVKFTLEGAAASAPVSASPTPKESAPASETPSEQPEQNILSAFGPAGWIIVGLALLAILATVLIRFTRNTK